MLLFEAVLVLSSYYCANLASLLTLFCFFTEPLYRLGMTYCLLFLDED